MPIILRLFALRVRSWSVVFGKRDGGSGSTSSALLTGCERAASSARADGSRHGANRERRDMEHLLWSLGDPDQQNVHGAGFVGEGDAAGPLKISRAVVPPVRAG